MNEDFIMSILTIVQLPPNTVFIPAEQTHDIDEVFCVFYLGGVGSVYELVPRSENPNGAALVKARDLPLYCFA